MPVEPGEVFNLESSADGESAIGLGNFELLLPSVHNVIHCFDLHFDDALYLRASR